MRNTMTLTVVMVTIALLGLTLCAEAGSVSGSVTDGPGGPGISKALVVLLSGNSVAAVGKTVSGGRYELDGVANGKYTIVVSASKYASKVDGINVSGDLVLNAPLTKLDNSDFKNLGRIVGFVKASGSKPVTKALLLLKKGNAFVGATQPQNATGVFELEWYAPGTYTVVATAPGHSTATYGNQKIPAGESLWLDVVLQPK